MNKGLKFTAWFLGLIVLALLLVNPVSRFLLNFGLKEASRNFSGSLEIQKINLAWGSISLEGITLASEKRVKILEIKKALVKYSFWQFLKNREISSGITEIFISEPFLNLRVDKQGVLNLSRFFPPPEKPAALGKSVSLPPYLHLENARVAFLDEKIPALTYDFTIPQLAIRNGKLSGEVRDGPVEFKVSGAYEPEKACWQLEILSSEFNLEHYLGRVFPQIKEWRGQSRFACRVDYDSRIDPKDSLTYQGELKLDSLGFKIPGYRYPFSRINGSLHFVPGLVWSPEISGDLGPGNFSFRGSALGTDPLFFKGFLQARNLDFSGIEQIKLTGFLKGDFYLRGSTLEPRLYGNFTIPKLGYAGKTLQHLTGSFQLDNQILYLPELRAGLSEGKLAAQGWILLGKTPSASLEIRAENFPLAELSPSLKGRAEFSGFLLGDLKNPCLIGKARGRNLEVSGSQLGNLEAGFLGDLNDLSGSGRLSKEPGQSISGFGGINLKEKTLDLGLRAKAFPLSYLNPGQKTLSCELNLDSICRGKWDDPQILALVSGDKIRLGDFGLRDFRGMISQENGGQTLFSSFIPQGGKRSYLSGGKAGDYLQFSASLQGADLTGLIKGFPRKSDWNFSLAGAGDYLVNADFSAEQQSGRAALLWNPSRLIPQLGFLSLKNLKIADFLPANLARFKFKGDWSAEGFFLENRDTYLSGQVSKGGFLGLPVSLFRGKLGGDSRSLTLYDGFLDSAGGLLWGGGNLNLARQSMDFKLQSPNFPLSGHFEMLDLSGFKCDLREAQATAKKEQLVVYADLVTELSGKFNSPQLAGKLNIKDGSWGYDPLTGKLVWVYTENLLAVKDFSLKYGRGSYWGRGEIGFKPKPALNLQLALKQIRLGDLLAFTTLKGMEITGLVDGNLKVTGDFNNPLLAGKIHLADGSVAGQQVDELLATFSSGNQRFNLSEFYARLGSGDLWGRGEINPDRSLKFSLAAQDFPLDQLDVLEKVFGQVSGRGDFNLTLTGKRDKPELTFDFNLKDLTLRGYPAELARGTLSWGDNRLQLSQLELSQEGKLTDLQGELTLPKNHWPTNRQEWRKCPLSLKLNTQGLELANLFGMFASPLKDKVSGLLSGSLVLNKSSDNPDFAVDFAIPQGKVGDIDFHDFQLRVKYQKPVITVEKFGFLTPQGGVDCTGSLDRQRNLILQAKVQQFPLGDFLSLWNLPVKTGGVLDLNLKAEKQLTDPDLTCDFKLVRGTLADFPFDFLAGDFNRRDGQFNIKQIILSKDKHAAVLQGILPLSIENGHLTGKTPMNLQLDYGQDDLSLLSIFLPVYQNSSGQVRLNAKAQGIFPQVDLSGGLTVRNGNLKLTPMENPISNILVTLQLSGNQLQVVDFSGKVGGGNFQMEKDSKVLFSGFVPAEYHLGLNLDNLGINYAKYFQGRVSGLLNLQTAEHKHILYGKLTPSGATVGLPTDLLENKKPAFIMPAFLKDFVFNLDIDLSNQVWLQFAGSNLYTTGDLRLGGTPDSLGMAGEVKLLRGSLALPFMERSFNLYRGTASFYQGGGFLPYLENVEGETKVGDYDIFMAFSGHLSGENYTLDLFSNPTLSKAQIMSLLLTGAFKPITGTQSNPNGIINSGSTSIFGLVQSTLIPGFTNAIGKALSLSELNISKTDSGVWNFYVSKALDRYEKLLLVYAQYLSTTQQIIKMWGLEYVLPKEMRLRVTQDNYGNVNYWWQWLRRF